MIGLVVKPAEQDIAQEFFELFKTAWEPWRDEGGYEVVMSTLPDAEAIPARLVVIFSSPHSGSAESVNVFERSSAIPTISASPDRSLPIYSGLVSFPSAGMPILRCEQTNEPVGYASCENGKTVLHLGYNLFEEVKFLLRKGQPALHAGVATIEEHLRLLRIWIARAGVVLVEIPPVPQGYNFIACLTHDVDHPLMRKHRLDHTALGFLYRAIFGTASDVWHGRKSTKQAWRNWVAACSMPFVHLGIAEDPWGRFDRYLDLEAGLSSTFFIIPREGYAGRTRHALGPVKRAARYSCQDLGPQLDRILSEGNEIGVHGIDAWLDDSAADSEQGTIAEVVGHDRLGVRMHWLYFDELSAPVLDRAGFSYDSSFGYNETVGFRAGTSQVYRPPGATNLLELPLIVMDTALFYPSYLNLAPADAEKVIVSLLDKAEEFGGAMTLNWHDRSIAPERLWDDFYMGVLAQLRRRRAWCPTGSRALAWFRKRRAVTFDASDDGFALAPKAAASEDLPGLTLRTHEAQPGRFRESELTSMQPVFVDSPCEHSFVMSSCL